ncbi:Glyoxalase family protein [hydrothermal vent metagenome]|uniref:Glyoxalase family protein n=1 Tax=hydrothermal vent metagenome TaxID=652676 RepID=A0A3B0WAZ4_9ZZZZ
MNEHEKINYVELPSKDLNATKEFFIQVFGWSFQDFGPEYSAFSNQGIDGVIIKQIFPFPGGRRFHFTEPGGNEFAVWSDKKA